MILRFPRVAIAGGRDPVVEHVAPRCHQPGETDYVYRSLGIVLGVPLDERWRTVSWPVGWTRRWETDVLALVLDAEGRPRVRMFVDHPRMEILRRYRIDVEGAIGSSAVDLERALVHDLAEREVVYRTPWRGLDADVHGEAIGWLLDHDARWDSPLAWDVGCPA